MAFCFEKSVDFKNPIDISDPQPDDWKKIDTNDYRHALFGFASCCFTEYQVEKM